VKVFYR